jgi:hypothetical protein
MPIIIGMVRPAKTTEAALWAVIQVGAHSLALAGIVIMDAMVTAMDLGTPIIQASALVI